MRIKVSGEWGFALVSLAAVGLFYGVLSFVVEKILLFNVPENRKDDHILSKLVFWVTVLLLIADILLVVLPIAGIQLLPFTLLDLI